MPEYTIGMAATQTDVLTELDIGDEGLTVTKLHLACEMACHNILVTRYEDVHRPVPDARCAAMLAGPLGPCIYKVKKEAKEVVTVDFLSAVVAPHTFEVLGPFLGAPLAKALLWAVCNSSSRIPDN